MMGDAKKSFFFFSFFPKYIFVPFISIITMPKKPRPPKNPDDDEAMDAYNEKLAIYKQEQSDKSVKKSTSSKSSNYNFQEIYNFQI